MGNMMHQYSRFQLYNQIHLNEIMLYNVIDFALLLSEQTSYYRIIFPIKTLTY